MLSALTWLVLAQNDELAALQERLQKLDKIPSLDAAEEEAKDLIQRLTDFLKKADVDKTFQANDHLSTLYQAMGKRHLLAKDLVKADDYYQRAVRTCRANVDKATALLKAVEDPDKATEQRALFAGYYYVVAIHHRAYALRSDPKRRDDLARQVEELDAFFKEFFNTFDTYFLALDAATFFGRCYQYLAETYPDRFSVADQNWEKCFKWLSKGRDLTNMRDMREQDDAHEVSARAVLYEVQARISYSKQLKNSGGPWERQLVKAQDAGSHFLNIFPSMRRSAIGQKIQDEMKAAAKLLEE